MQAPYVCNEYKTLFLKTLKMIKYDGENTSEENDDGFNKCYVLKLLYISIIQR